MGTIKSSAAGAGNRGQLHSPVTSTSTLCLIQESAVWILRSLSLSSAEPPLSERAACVVRRTLQGLMLRSDQTDLVFGCSHISQPVLQHMACCPQLRQLTISSAELMAVDLSSLSYLTALEVRPA